VKLEALARMAKGENVDELAAEIGVDRRSVYRWREIFEQHGENAFQPVGRRRRRKRPEVVDPVVKPKPPDELSTARQKVAALERKIGQQQLELDFFRRALRQVRGTDRANAGPGGTTSTRSSKR
jgi:transposase-like protein